MGSSARRPEYQRTSALGPASRKSTPERGDDEADQADEENDVTAMDVAETAAGDDEDHQSDLTERADALHGA